MGAINPGFTNHLTLRRTGHRQAPSGSSHIAVLGCSMGKEIHTEEASFLSGVSSPGGGIQQRLIKLYPHQMVTFSVGYPYHSCPQVA